MIICGNRYIQVTKEGPHGLVEDDVKEALSSRPSIQQVFIRTLVNYLFVTSDDLLSTGSQHWILPDFRLQP
jgi:hypothetical protein